MSKDKKIMIGVLSVLCFIIFVLIIFPQKRISEIVKKGTINNTVVEDESYTAPYDDEWKTADEELEDEPIYSLIFVDTDDQLVQDEFLTLKGHLTKAEALAQFLEDNDMEEDEVIVRTKGTYKFRNNSYFILDLPHYPDLCIHGVFHGIVEDFEFELADVDAVFDIPYSSISLGE